MLYGYHVNYFLNGISQLNSFIGIIRCLGNKYSYIDFLDTSVGCAVGILFPQ